MNSQLETVRRLYSHPPEQSGTIEAHTVRRVGALDRAAMHLGVALIKWGRRPVKANLLERLGFTAETDEAIRRLEEARDLTMATSLNRIR